MAELTGQFTTPGLDAQNNKTHKPLLHAVVFVFTGAPKVSRETDAKGKYSFDLANGEYEVSVYLKGNTEKDRFDMRAGEKFTVTAATQANALEKWLQVIGTSGKDELATYYENLLAQMQKVSDDFKRDTEFVGDLKEPIMRRGYLGIGGTEMPITREDDLIVRTGFYRIFYNSGSFHYGSALNMQYSSGISTLFGVKSVSAKVPRFIADHYNQRGAEKVTIEFYTTGNTTVDSNGFIKAASPIIKLFNDRIEHSGFEDNEPIFEKLSTGTYKISNTLGLAQEGWTYEKPRGNDGQPYFRIIVEKLEDGCIVRVHDEYDTVEKAEITDIDGNTRTVDKIVKILGQARDIKEHERWIDLRFHEEPEEHQEMEEELLTEHDDSVM